jgi:hypothetical protein
MILDHGFFFNEGEFYNACYNSAFWPCDLSGRPGSRPAAGRFDEENTNDFSNPEDRSFVFHGMMVRSRLRQERRPIIGSLAAFNTIPQPAVTTRGPLRRCAISSLPSVSPVMLAPLVLPSHLPPPHCYAMRGAPRWRLGRAFPKLSGGMREPSGKLIWPLNQSHKGFQGGQDHENRNDANQ